MDKKELFNYYKECYYHDLQHKDSINNRVAVPTGIIPLLIAGDIYFLNNLEYIHEYWKLVALIGVILFSLGIVITIYYIFRTMFNHKIAYVSSLDDVDTYWKSLINDGYDEDVIENEMDEFIGEQFIEYSTINRTANIAKINYLRRVFFCLVFTLVIGLANIYPFTFQKTDGADITKVDIIKENYEKGKNNDD